MSTTLIGNCPMTPYGKDFIREQARSRQFGHRIWTKNIALFEALDLQSDQYRAAAVAGREFVASTNPDDVQVFAVAAMASSDVEIRGKVMMVLREQVLNQIEAANRLLGQMPPECGGSVTMADLIGYLKDKECRHE